MKTGTMLWLMMLGLAVLGGCEDDKDETVTDGDDAVEDGDSGDNDRMG